MMFSQNGCSLVQGGFISDKLLLLGNGWEFCVDDVTGFSCVLRLIPLKGFTHRRFFLLLLQDGAVLVADDYSSSCLERLYILRNYLYSVFLLAYRSLFLSSALFFFPLLLSFSLFRHMMFICYAPYTLNGEPPGESSSLHVPRMKSWIQNKGKVEKN